MINVAKMMVIKYGRYGKFLACPGYPECKNAKPLVENIDVHASMWSKSTSYEKPKEERIIIFVRIT